MYYSAHPQETRFGHVVSTAGGFTSPYPTWNGGNRRPEAARIPLRTTHMRNPTSSLITAAKNLDNRRIIGTNPIQEYTGSFFALYTLSVSGIPPVNTYVVLKDRAQLDQNEYRTDAERIDGSVEEGTEGGRTCEE